jgi:hypothetical protein
MASPRAAFCSTLDGQSRALTSRPPTEQGVVLAKDVWLAAAIAVSLIVDDLFGR